MCDMTGNNDDLDRSSRSDADDREWSNTGQILMAERSGGRVTPYVICTMHKETRNASFLVCHQNQGRRFPGLGIKTDSSDLVIWDSKSPRRFLSLWLKTNRISVC
jgi:hypothetical protein